MLPKDASAVDFGPVPEGQRGWSSYREAVRFEGISMQKAFEAAKAGLAFADFALARADPVNGVAIGKHGMTAHDWNVLAGVYFREENGGVSVVVLVEGSKDIGFSGDVTGGAWTGKIVQGMRSHLKL